jgi:hypothetical protein
MVPNSTSSNPKSVKKDNEMNSVNAVKKDKEMNSVKKDKEQQRRMNSVNANTSDIKKCCCHTQLKKNSVQGSELRNKEKSPLLKDMCSPSISCTSRSRRGVVVNLTQKQDKDDRGRLKTCRIEGNDNSTDEELERKARAAEEQAQLLLEDMEYLTKSSVKVSPYKKAESENVKVELLQLKVKKLLQEKRNLVLQVACETRSRIAERCAANEALEVDRKREECTAVKIRERV